MSKKKHEEHENHERWLVSYADFITLLFAFFATMYAVSRLDAQRLTTVAESMQMAFDRAPANRRAMVPSKAMLDAQRAEQSSEEIRQIVSRDLTPELAADRLELFVDRRGVVLVVDHQRQQVAAQVKQRRRVIRRLSAGGGQFAEESFRRAHKPVMDEAFGKDDVRPQRVDISGRDQRHEGERLHRA